MKQLKSPNTSCGTSFHGHTINCTVNDLISKCGEPMSCGDSDDKVQYEWLMETDSGTFFTIYDWKEYRQYGKDTNIEWHIGAHRAIDAMESLDELRKTLTF